MIAKQLLLGKFNDDTVKQKLFSYWKKSLPSASCNDKTKTREK
jgi:hypothetical protein